MLGNQSSGPADEARVERWARTIAIAQGSDPDADGLDCGPLVWNMYEIEARAAIALADQEAAEGVEPGSTWAEYERLRDEFASGHQAVGYRGAYASDETEVDRAALDAFVRRLIRGSRTDGVQP